MKNPGTNPLASLICVGALLALVIGSALAVGSVHNDVLLWVAGFAIASTSIVLLLARSEIRRLPSPALILLALSAWSGLQAIPLPLGLLSRIAPHTADIWARALRPFDEPTLRFGAISLDPGASLVEALKWFSYAMVFTLATLASSWRSVTSVVGIAFGGAMAVALVALGHGLLGATSLFGLYTPELAVPRWGLPPILNPNNLSAYLNLGAFCGLGLLVAQHGEAEPKSIIRRGIIGAGLAIVVAVSVLAASRAGVLGFSLGVMLFAALVWISRSERRERDDVRVGKTTHVRAMVPAAVAVGGGVLLAIVGASEATWSELWDSNVEKLRVASWSVPLIREFPVFGVGRGAFESVFPAYRPASGHILYAYPENFVIQWISEWGAPAAAAVSLSLIWLYRPSRGPGKSDTRRIGAWVGIGVLLLQNLVDLALEVPAVAILTCTVLGALYSEHAVSKGSSQNEGSAVKRRRHERTFLFRVRRRAFASSILAAGVVAVGLASVFGRQSDSDERSHLHAAYQALHLEDSGALAAFRNRLRQTVLRHPAEPYFRLLGALVASRTNDRNVLTWISAALERDPTNGRTHLLLADVLASKGATQQALMELRLAIEGESALVWTAGQSANRFTQDPDLLERAAPDGPLGATTLLAIASAAQGNDKHGLRMTLLERAVARDPASVDALTGRAMELLLTIASDLPACRTSERISCLSRIRQDADSIRRNAPGSCEPVILEARVLDLEGQSDAAEQLLGLRCNTCKETESCVTEHVRLAAKNKTSESLVGAVRAYLAVACSRETPCVHPQLFIGDLFAARINWSTAAEHYRLAALAADSADIWLRAADAASRAGNPVLASQALRRAQRRGAGDPALERRVREQNDEILRQELELVRPPN